MWRSTRHRGWLAGLLMLFYGIGVWSAWYLRGADADAISMLQDFDQGDGGLDVGD